MARCSGVAQEERDRLAIEPGEVHKVDRINTPLAGLAFRHEGLRSMKRLRDRNLRQTGSRSRLSKPPKHRFVPRLVNSPHIPH